MNENNRYRDLKLGNEKFKQEIEEIKKKYEEEIKIKINKYKNNNNNINNKYRKINEKNNIIFKSKINELYKKYNEEIENLGLDKKIENLNNIIKFNEIIYHTYMLYNQNYFNCININNLLNNYYKSETIRNNVIKKVLKDNYDKVTELILERNNQYDDKKEKKIQEDKENDKKTIEILKKELEEERELNKKAKDIIREKDEEIEKLKQERYNIKKTNLEAID